MYVYINNIRCVHNYNIPLLYRLKIGRWLRTGQAKDKGNGNQQKWVQSTVATSEVYEG